MNNKTIHIVRTDENEGYDRQKLADYLDRLKKEIPQNTFLSREVVKNDRTHVEIVETKTAKERDSFASKGFTTI